MVGIARAMAWVRLQHWRNAVLTTEFEVCTILWRFVPPRFCIFLERKRLTAVACPDHAACNICGAEWISQVRADVLADQTCVPTPLCSAPHILHFPGYRSESCGVWPSREIRQTAESKLDLYSRCALMGVFACLTSVCCSPC